MFPKPLHLENTYSSSSYGIESACKRWLVLSEFDIKVTRYRSCITDRIETARRESEETFMCDFSHDMYTNIPKTRTISHIKCNIPYF